MTDDESEAIEWREWARRWLGDLGHTMPIFDQQLRGELDCYLERLLTCGRCGRVGEGSLCLACDQAIAMGKDPQPYSPSGDMDLGGGILAGERATEAAAQRRRETPVSTHALDSLANRLFIAALTDEEDWNNEWDDTAVLNALRRVRHILSIVADAGGIRGSGGGIGAKGHSKRRRQK